jgi:hypothetical protein
MKLSMINTFPIWGGDAKWTINLGAGIMDKGHYVAIACQAKSINYKKATQNGLNTFSLNIGRDISFWKVPTIIRFIKKHGRSGNNAF